MSKASRRILTMAAWLLVAALLAIGFLWMDRLRKPMTALPPARPTTIASTSTAPAVPSPIPIRSWGELLHADIPSYPETRPYAFAVDLPEAAHLLLKEKLYVYPGGDLWIARKDADPLPAVLARAGDESEHIADEPVEFVIWTLQRGKYQASAVCRGTDGDELVTTTDRRPILPRRSYHWESAANFDDNGVSRLFVPTDGGASIFTLGKNLTEVHCDLVDSSAATQRQAPVPQFVFDMRGLLVWIPADSNFDGSSRVARFVDGKWDTLDSAAWPSNIIQLVPMRDGSVLQIRRGADAGTVDLQIIALDSAALDLADVDKLVAQLDDDDPDKRAAAFGQLTEYGPGIYSRLEQLKPNAGPEGQARIQNLLDGRLATKLGGMLINNNQLTVACRLREGGVIFFAPAGVSVDQGQQPPRVVSPDYLVVRPGQYIQELPVEITEQLAKTPSINAMKGEWIINSPQDGPLRYLPPSQFIPLQRPTERAFSQLLAIDSRGRWIFRAPDAASPTLIIDPTVPDPVPRLAIWLIDTASDAGWDKNGWPALTQNNSNWIITQRDWEVLDPKETIQTDISQLKSTTQSSATTRDGPVLWTDFQGNRYFDGQTTLTSITPTGQRRVWPLSADCLSTSLQSPWLIGDHAGHLYLFNNAGSIIRLRATPNAAQPFVLEAIFNKNIPPFQDTRRIWMDPAGRIAVAYEQSHLAIIFPSGQVPPELNDKILPQDLRRTDEP
jgi:hypothetical protein